MILVPKRKLISGVEGNLGIQQPIDAAQLLPATIIGDVIKDGVISADKIAADTIVAANIAAGAVGASELAAGAVVAGKIATDAITAEGAEIADATIVTAKIAALAVDTGQIADLAVTDAKINDLGVDKLTAGSITSKAITLAVAADTGDSKIQAGKTDFNNTDSGFILGLDDSDSDKAKFYIGDADTYLNWTGAGLAVKGTVTITPGSSGLANLDDATADNIAETETQKWAAETGADITGSHIYSLDYADFPDSTTVGDLAFAEDRGVVYRWNGTDWVPITIHSSSGIIGNIPAATDLPEGSIYFATDALISFQVQSGAWVPMSVEGADFVKSATQTVNNSTVFVDDNAIYFYLPAHSSGGLVMNNLQVQSAVDADMKFRWTYPAGCTINWDIDSLGPFVETDTAIRPCSGEVEDISALNELYANIINDATAGWMKFQWAQNVAQASDTKVLGSSTFGYYWIERYFSRP